MTSPCATCPTARCCTVFDPELTGADVARLSGRLRLEPRVFAELAPVRADAVGPDGIRLGGVETRELRLRRTTTAEGEGGARRCVFLMHLGPGLNRCGVHAVRPALCRLYPSDATRFGIMVGTPTDICPPDAWAPERVDLVPLRAAHATAAVERARWRAFLEAWDAPAHQRALASLPTEVARDRLFAALLAFEEAFARTGSDSADPFHADAPEAGCLPPEPDAAAGKVA